MRRPSRANCADSRSVACRSGPSARLPVTRVPNLRATVPTGADHAFAVRTELRAAHETFVGPELRQPGNAAQYRPDPSPVNVGTAGIGFIEPQRLNEPEQRVEIVSFADQLIARGDVEANQALPAFFGPGAGHLPRAMLLHQRHGGDTQADD